MLVRLGGMDAAFLTMDTPATHMHVAQACVFDPSLVSGGYSFERLYELVSDRLPLVPPFRRRLVEVPFGLYHPAWIEDPDFCLDNHLHRAVLAPPGGVAELAALTAQVISQPLDRSRPLWEMHVVEGLDGGMVAAITKVHHSVTDGISGAAMTAQLLDVEPDPAPRVVVGPWGGWSPDRVPSAPERLVSAAGALLGQPMKVALAAGHLAGAIGRVRRHNRRPGASVPPALFSGPRTMFNTSISPARSVAFTQLDEDDVGAIKDRVGTTPNDVVLAVCAGALRSFLTEHGGAPDRPLVAAVPRSIRVASESSGGAAKSNRLSVMLVNLATTIADPVERLQAIAQSTREAKEQDRLLGESMLDELAGLLPPIVGAPLVRALSGLGLMHRPKPVVNLMISNFSGPRFPLYCAGAKLVAPYPMGPIIDGMGLNITLQSYLGTLFVGLVGDGRVPHDLAALASVLPEELALLAKATA